MGASGAYDLQDASLVQLLCHVSHIKEAWELGARDTAEESWHQVSRAERRGSQRREGAEKGRSEVGERELTFPGVGLRQWMT